MVTNSKVKIQNSKSICLFCSLGCGTAFRMRGEEAIAIDYDGENPINLGALCPRGHYNLEYLNHPQRLTAPRLGPRPVSWEEAASFIKQELNILSKDEFGILISCLTSNEDAAAITNLAKTLGIKNVLSAGTSADLEAYEGFKWQVPGAELATMEDIENSDTLLIVGDLLTRTPVLSKRVNKVKYGKRGNKIMVIDPNRTHTAWFATDHLACRPGTEAVVLAALSGELPVAEAVEVTGLPAGRLTTAANDFKASAKGTVVYVPQEGAQRHDLGVYYAKRLAAASANIKYIVLYQFGNTLGVNSIIDREAPEHPTYHELLAKVERNEVKALLMFGEDISAGHPELQKKFRMLKFVAFSGHFESESPAIYDTSVILPQATQMEAAGSFLLADGRVEKLAPLAAPAGERTCAEICRMIGGNTTAGNSEPQLASKQKDPAEILAGLRAIAPLAAMPLEPITSFGNDHLVKNFFWHRVNNG
jgi:anaerobic selenocysteine-containing dehydrogenase